MAFKINPPLYGAVRGECVCATTGGTCGFECDLGFGLSGAPSTTCFPNGWNSVPPVCVSIECRNQTAPPFDVGRLEGTCAPGRGGLTCSIACNPGLRPGPTGSPTILCQENRTWNDTLATCVPIMCGNLPIRIPNGRGTGDCAPGRALHTCVYACDEGHAVTAGSSVLLCEVTGNWTGTVPTCSRINCRSIVGRMGEQTVSGKR